uniref:Uncharacterized protein n=1 Tax=Ditylenchus dipsaci TaxID=166011 RepID=A0A915EGH2_9BILA
MKHLSCPALQKASPDSPVKVIAKMFTNFIRAADYNETRIAPWKHSYSRLKQLNKMLENHRESRKYKRRMLDVVVDFDKKYRRTKSISERISDMIPQHSKNQMPKLMPHLYNLVDAMGKNNNQSNVRFLSPQLASVVNKYDESETRNHFLNLTLN